MDCGLTKKTYRELISIILLYVLYCAIMLLFIFCVLITYSTVMFVSMVATALCLILSIVDFIKRKKIVLDVDNIFVPGGFRYNDAAQKKVDIKYIDIKKISCEDSLDHGETKANWFTRVFTRTRVILETKTGEQHRIFISWYTQKTKVQILDDIIARCAAVGNKLDVPCGEELLINRKK